MSTGYGDLYIFQSLAGNPSGASAAGSALDVEGIRRPILGVIARGYTSAASAIVQYSDDNSTWSDLSGTSVSLGAATAGYPVVGRILIANPTARYYRWKLGQPATGSAAATGIFIVSYRHDNYLPAGMTASAIVVV